LSFKHIENPYIRVDFKSNLSVK